MTRPVRSVVTVLFTDIVGSTELVAALGDAEWGRVLEAHHALVRRNIRRFGGREANTAGDGFLATFAEPAQAIRCAWEIAVGVRKLGVDVRSGVHTGEVEGAGRDLKGLGIHIGSRVASLAGPGEVLVTRTSRELVAGAGFEFEDRGEQRLRGVPEEWRLYRVVGLPTVSSLPRDSQWWVIAGRKTRLAILVVGIAVVAAIAVLVAPRMRESPPPLRGAAAPGIAILPFRVGHGLDEWREGMVDLLSTNLDGAGGLRAIDSRTVLARWREAAIEEDDLDLEAALAVATQTGASYAVVGTVVQVGPELRLAGDVYDLGEGAQLGTVHVTGPPDSVAMLVDRLTIQILREIVSKGANEPASVPHLASVTTASLPALRSFLEGEVLYRRGAFSEAAAAYERAVQSDSSFGLAYYRLSEACGFSDCPPNKVPDSMRRAFELSDRMPAREAMLVRAANYSWSGHDPYHAIEILLEVVNRYPDDPEAWYILGETYVHYGGQIMAEDGGNWQEVMARAVRLDPSTLVFMQHLIEDAFMEADSARVVDWGERYFSAGGLDPGSFITDPTFILAFGDSATRQALLNASDTFDTADLAGMAATLRHPRHLSIQEELYRTAMSDPTAPAVLEVLASENLFRQGKVVASRALRIDTTRMSIEVQREALFSLFKHHTLLGELGVSTVELEEALSNAASDTMTWFLAGAHAAERGRWGEHSSAVLRLRDTAKETRAAGDSVRGRLFDGAANALTGYGLWRQGRQEDAVVLLETSRREVVTLDYLDFDYLFAWNGIIRYWLASVSLEIDQPEQAVKYLESLRREHLGRFNDPYVEYELARVQDRLGMRAEAIRGYENAAVAWRNADPALQPRVEAIRRAITRLSGAEN